jgi:hypothetical protein
MTILKNIWSFINSKFFGYVVAIILIFLLAQQCKEKKDLKIDNIKKEQNIAAADTAIKIYKGKHNQLVAEKAIWISTEKELKDQNRYLYDQIQEQSGRIISLNNVVFGLNQDINILHDTINFLHKKIGNAVQINKTEWLIPWELDYNWDKDNYDVFKGHTIVTLDTNTLKITHKNTLLDNRNSQIDLVFGEKVVDGKYQVYITTKYPGLSPKSMSGVFIDPNSNSDIKRLIHKNHWFNGFSINIGISPTYDFFAKRPTIIVGPCLGYSIYNW